MMVMKDVIEKMMGEINRKLNKVIFEIREGIRSKESVLKELESEEYKELLLELKDFKKILDDFEEIIFELGFLLGKFNAVVKFSKGGENREEMSWR